MLSWDLHLHPGPSAAPRWGDGRRVWDAARAIGLRGFVWKSHEEHTVDRCRALPAGPPLAIASASLNPWTTLEQVIDALDHGARWIWGPSRDADGKPAWDLPLPPWWLELREHLSQVRRSVALATSHLGPAGRRAFAETAAAVPTVASSVTHSLYLDRAEADALGSLGCAFEFDLYTSIYPVPGRPAGDLVELATQRLERGSLAYLTSDAGQAHVGNPFEFSAAVLADLSKRIARPLLHSLAVDGPAEFVGRVLPAEVAA